MKLPSISNGLGDKLGLVSFHWLAMADPQMLRAAVEMVRIPTNTVLVRLLSGGAMRGCYFISAALVLVGCSPQTSVPEIFPDSVAVPDHIPDSFDATNKDGTHQIVEGKHLYAYHYANGWNRCRRAYLSGKLGSSLSQSSDQTYNRLVQTWGYGIEGWQAGNDACLDAIIASRSGLHSRSAIVGIFTAAGLAAIGDAWLRRCRAKRVAQLDPH